MIAYIRLRSFDMSCLHDAWNRLSSKSTHKVGLPTHKKLYTLLRSPHVHKTARDQYFFKVKHALLVLPQPTPSKLMECFDLPGVSCTIRIVGQSQFPEET